MEDRMKQLKSIVTLMLAIVLLAAFTLVAQTPQYVGADKCKMCHMSKAKGDSYGVWKTSKHAQAFATLATPEAIAIGKKAGVEDPQKSPKCLKCHVTAFTAPATAKAATYKPEDGVGCETCHGAGSLYKDMKVMKALQAGTQDAKAVGYVKGDKTKCVTCHNQESPTYKEFKAEDAFKKIVHAMPKS
jgi:hypothetical protein